MNPAKEEVRRILEEVPDDASFEDIQYHIYVRQKVEKTLVQVEAGQVLSDEQAEARFSRWLTP
jgi:hypothetical protein